MKIKNIIKIICILIILFILLIPINSVQAAESTCPICKGSGYIPGTKCPTCNGKGTVGSGGSGGSSDQTVINPDDFKPGELTSSDTQTAFKSAGTIAKAIVYVGLVISIVMIMVLGIKYMMGSVEERAEYKKTLVPVLIGTLLIFTTGTIVSIIWNIMENINA